MMKSRMASKNQPKQPRKVGLALRQCLADDMTNGHTEYKNLSQRRIQQSNLERCKKRK